MKGYILASTGWQNIFEKVTEWCLTLGKNILIAILVLLIGSRLIKWLIKHIAKSFQKTRLDPMVAKFLSSLIKFILYFVMFIVVIGILGIPTTSFIAALSAAGLAIGLALQGSLSNFAGGVLILIFKPFGIGDYIKEDTHGNEGTVVGIDLFYTKLLTSDNKKAVIPNGILANASLTNYTASEKRRVDIKIGISYDADIKQAKDILMDVIQTHGEILKDEDVLVYVDSLEESQVTLGTRVWVHTDDYWNTKWALTEEYKKEFDKNGIEIPFNQLSVTINNKQVN